VSETTTIPTARPRAFYGWTMLGVATAAYIATGPGQTAIVSQFNSSLRADLGLSASALGAAYMIGTVSAALPLVFVGKASDRFGPRVVMGVIAALFGLACAATGLVRGVVGLTVAFFLLRFLGQGALGLVSGHQLALWFERRLGTAHGLKMMGAQLGFAVMPAAALALIEWFGWRAAYAALGGFVALVVLPLVVFVARDHPSEMGQKLDGDPAVDPPGREHDDESEELDPTGHRHVDPAFTLGGALRAWSFWTVALTIALHGLIGTALIFHAQPLLEAHGADPESSAAVVRTWSLVMMLTIFPAGWLADRLPARAMLPASLAVAAGATLLPLAPGGALVMHASLGLFAVGQSLVMGSGTPTIARYFGRAHHGAIRAAATILAVAGTGLGPVMLGLSLDGLGSFTPGLVVLAAMCAPPAIAGLALRRPEPPASTCSAQAL